MHAGGPRTSKACYCRCILRFFMMVAGVDRDDGGGIAVPAGRGVPTVSAQAAVVVDGMSLGRPMKGHLPCPGPAPHLTPDTHPAHALLSHN